MRKILIIVLALIIAFGAWLLSSQQESEQRGEVFSPDVSIQNTSETNRQLQYDQYGITLEYPGELELQAFRESRGGETLVLQRPETSKQKEETLDDKLGFQMFITPFDEEFLTPERIRQDLPSATINEPVEVLIGREKNKQALIFFSEAPVIGDTREIWFIHNGHLFEISTYAELDSWIGPITETFEFF